MSYNNLSKILIEIYTTVRYTTDIEYFKLSYDGLLTSFCGPQSQNVAYLSSY